MKALHPQNLNNNVGGQTPSPADTPAGIPPIVGAAIPWAQFIGRNLDAYDATYKDNETRVVNTFIVPAWQIADFVAITLGYAYILDDDPFPGFLHRVLPMQCPEVPYLYATAITGVKPLGRGNDPAIIANNGGPGQLLIQGQYGPYAGFGYYKVTVLFQSLAYDVIPDSAITLGGSNNGEQSRFVERRPAGSGEILQYDKGAFLWDTEAPFVGANKNVQFGPGFPVGKVRETWIWRAVPDFGLFTGQGSSSGGIPLMLQSCLNMVNWAGPGTQPTDANDFMGRFPMTMLLQNWSMTPSVFPINPIAYMKLTGWSPLNGNFNQQVRRWDVTLSMLYYDMNAAQPVGQPANPYTEANYPYHGHNIFPSPNGKFYAMFRAMPIRGGSWNVTGPPPDNAPALPGTPMYGLAPFTNIFKMNIT